MAHEDELLGLVLNLLDRVDHADIPAHLERSLSKGQFEVLQALLAEAVEKLGRILIADLGHLNALLILLQSKALEEVTHVALIGLARTLPGVERRMRLQVLTADSVRHSATEDEAGLEDQRLQILVEESDNTGLVLFDLLELEILWQVHDLRALETERLEQIRLHLLFIDRHEQVGLIDVPKHVMRLRLEVRHEDHRLLDRAEQVPIARLVDADAARARLVREHLDDRILGLVLANDGVVLDEEVLNLAIHVDSDHEVARHGDVDDRRLGLLVQRELAHLLLVILDRVQEHLAISEGSRPALVHDNLLHGALEVALAHQLHHRLGRDVRRADGPPPIIPDGIVDADAEMVRPDAHVLRLNF